MPCYGTIPKFNDMIDDILKNPLETIKTILESNILDTMTLQIRKANCSHCTLILLKALPIIYNVFVDHDLSGGLCVKFFNKLRKSALLDNVAKIICNSNLGSDEIRKFLSNITLSIIHIMPKMTEIQKKLFMASLARLLFGSLHTKHMILCIIHINTKVFRSNFIITKDTPTYITAWLNLSTTKHNVDFMVLGLLPLMLSVMLDYKMTLPDKILLKFVHNIKITLKTAPEKENPILKHFLKLCKN
jgi:hypothetical protein